MNNQPSKKLNNNRDDIANKVTKNAIKRIWQGRQDSNLRHLVLETSTLPTELLPYDSIYKLYHYDCISIISIQNSLLMV